MVMSTGLLGLAMLHCQSSWPCTGAEVINDPVAYCSLLEEVEQQLQQGKGRGKVDLVFGLQGRCPSDQQALGVTSQVLSLLVDMTTYIPASSHNTAGRYVMALRRSQIASHN